MLLLTGWVANSSLPLEYGLILSNDDTVFIEAGSQNSWTVQIYRCVLLVTLLSGNLRQNYLVILNSFFFYIFLWFAFFKVAFLFTLAFYFLGITVLLLLQLFDQFDVRWVLLLTLFIDVLLLIAWGTVVPHLLVSLLAHGKRVCEIKLSVTNLIYLINNSTMLK